TARDAERRMAELDSLIDAVEAQRAALEDTLAEEYGTALDCVRAEVGPRNAEALELYYLDPAPTWSDVAREMGMSYRHVCRLRSEAYEWLDASRRRFFR
ncbi:MAG: hypothetical protein Q4B54_13340, partial [Coriobacteriales bacterium]|nr:hypothetical protein [Coriobacteriales bacterium]